MELICGSPASAADPTFKAYCTILRIRRSKHHLDVLCECRLASIILLTYFIRPADWHTIITTPGRYSNTPIRSSYSHPHQRVLIICREKDDYFPQIFYGYPNSFMGHFYFHCPVGIYAHHILTSTEEY